MYFDTHAHYDDESFSEDRDSVLAALPGAGVELVVNPGQDAETSCIAMRLAGKYPYIYAAAGIHPHEASKATDEELGSIEKLLRMPRCVALGEVGLDYHYDFSPREQQKEALYKQLELARSYDLPVIFHNREAHADSLSAVRAFPGLRGVFHCFSGSLETALELVSLGWYISFTGSITFKNARRAPEIAASLPSDRIMIETDSPYMSPVPIRGTRNDSRNLKHICAALSAYRGISIEEAAAQTLNNGKTFFGIR